MLIVKESRKTAIDGGIKYRKRYEKEPCGRRNIQYGISKGQRKMELKETLWVSSNMEGEETLRASEFEMRGGLLGLREEN